MHIFTREEFYERVWAEPMTAVAERYGADVSHLRTLCRRAAIPLPKVGYWQKLWAGKPVSPTPLPLRPPGALPIITTGYYRSWWRSPREMLSDPAPLKPEFPESIEQLTERVTAEVGTAPLSARHRSKVRVAKRETVSAGRRQLLDRLGFGLSKLGAELLVRRDDEAVVMRAHGADIAFTLDHSKVEENCFVLQFKAEERYRQWRIGGDDETVDAQLREIAIALLIAAEVLRRQIEEVHYQHCLDRRVDAEKDARKRHAKAKRLLAERQRLHEERRRQRLLAQAEAWRTAQDIRGFVADVLGQAERAGGKHELAAWADWARREADALDPVKQDELIVPR